MKQLTCEMCGGTDLIKEEGIFVCQICGCKYSVEEAKRMMVEGTVDVQGTVKVDNTAFVQKYLANARRAKQKEDWGETEKYYNMVEQNEPTNIEAIFYSSFARVKQALLEAETKDKRQSVFNVLVKSVSVIDDNYDKTCEEHKKLLYAIMDDIYSLKKGTIVPTTHLQEYVTKNGYGSIVDRNQIVENDSLAVTYDMIKEVINAYKESLINIYAVLCNDLSTEQIFNEARESLQNGYPIFALAYFDGYIKKNTNSPVGYLGKAVALGFSEGDELDLVNQIEKASKLTISATDKEKVDYLINEKCGPYEITLLIYAVANYNYAAVEFLVNNGVNINARSKQNVTALWYIAYKALPDNRVDAGRKIAKLLLDNGAVVDVTNLGGVALYNNQTDLEIERMIKKLNSAVSKGKEAKTAGCYVATAVYGSYDCSEVWTLRRFRDYNLAETWYGRAFIHAYYAISPTLVKWFGHTEWFKSMSRGKLDRMVKNLQDKGYESTPYEDKEW